MVSPSAGKSGNCRHQRVRRGEGSVAEEACCVLRLCQSLQTQMPKELGTNPERVKQDRREIIRYSGNWANRRTIVLFKGQPPKRLEQAHVDKEVLSQTSC